MDDLANIPVFTGNTGSKKVKVAPPPPFVSYFTFVVSLATNQVLRKRILRGHGYPNISDCPGGRPGGVLVCDPPQPPGF